MAKKKLGYGTAQMVNGIATELLETASAFKGAYGHELWQAIIDGHAWLFSDDKGNLILHVSVEKQANKEGVLTMLGRIKILKRALADLQAGRAEERSTLGWNYKDNGLTQREINAKLKGV